MTLTFNYSYKNFTFWFSHKSYVAKRVNRTHYRVSCLQDKHTEVVHRKVLLHHFMRGELNIVEGQL